MKGNQSATVRNGTRTILYPRRIVAVVNHALGLRLPPALVINKTSRGYRNYPVEANY